MLMLPDALSALGQYRQFIVYTLEDIGNGKTNKYPVNPFTMERSDAHDPNIWVDSATACAISQSTGMGVGFVFTEQDPFFFLDIDECMTPDGQWSENAKYFCNLFAGCAVEISNSGRGLHIIGTGQAVETRRKKNKEYHIELYTDKRFVALTGTGAVGDANFNHQEKLTEVVNYFFWKDPNITEADWTNQPCEGWAGYVDDEDLINRALQSQSASSVLGGGVSFRDLWEGNVAKLAEKYPSSTGKDFDHSNADAALMQHLAFWTGKDCERMDRLFRRSALMRDKYEKRKDYRYDTVTGACGGCKKVHNTVKSPLEQEYAENVISPSETPVTEFKCVSKGGVPLLSPEQQVDHFRGCVYVSEDHRILTPKGQMLKPDVFKVVYGGYDFVMDYASSKTSNNAFDVFTQSRAIAFPKADRTCFRPEHACGECIVEDEDTLVNVYKPVHVETEAGDIQPFLDHMERIMPDPTDRRILLNWMAAAVQYKGVKFQWAPLIQGAEGNGKTLFARCLQYAIGHRYCHSPKAKELAGSGSTFNGWIENKLLVCIEEIHMGNKRELADELKETITNDKIEAQSKGADQKMIDNRANFIMSSNHKDAVIKQKTDRRYACFFTKQQTEEELIADGFLLPNGESTPLMYNMYEWLKGGGYKFVAHYLQTFQIEDKLNPAKMCHRAPRTSSTDEAIYNSLGTAELEILEAVDSERMGFRGGYISSVAISNLLKDLRMETKIPNNKRKDMMYKLGYVLHPHLPNGRLNTTTDMDEGKKPRIYVKIGSLQSQITDSATISSSYIGANQLEGGFKDAQQKFGSPTA